MTTRVVYVPARGPVTLHSTDDPETWFAESTTVGGKTYRIVGVGTANPACICPARKDCVHLLAAMRMTLEDSMTDTEELPEAVGQSAAVVPFRQSTSALDARRAVTAGSQAIALSARSQVEGYKEYLYLAQQMGDTGLFPTSIKTPQAAAIVMMKAAELGVPPMAALELFYVVGNKVGIQSQMIAALIERSGKGYVEVIESTAERATVVGHREGRPSMTVTWTPEMAEAANSKSMGGWTDKLVWKAIARIGRRMFADVLGGMDVGDGSGVVIDEGIVPEREGEYRATVDAPPVEEAPKPGVPAWMPEFRDAVKEAGVALKPFYPYFDATTNEAMFEAITKWLAEVEGRTPRALVSAVADWDAAGRPARTAPPAPVEDAQEALFEEMPE